MWWARHCHFWINQELTLRRDDATFDVIPSGCKFRAWDIPQFTYLIRRGSITAQLTCHGLKLSTVPTTQSKLIQSAYSLDKPSTVCGTSACAMSSSRNRSRDCHTWTSHSTSGFDNELEADRSFSTNIDRSATASQKPVWISLWIIFFYVLEYWKVADCSNDILTKHYFLKVNIDYRATVWWRPAVILLDVIYEPGGLEFAQRTSGRDRRRGGLVRLFVFEHSRLGPSGNKKLIIFSFC